MIYKGMRPIQTAGDHWPEDIQPGDAVWYNNRKWFVITKFELADGRVTYLLKRYTVLGNVQAVIV